MGEVVWLLWELNPPSTVAAWPYEDMLSVLQLSRQAGWVRWWQVQCQEPHKRPGKGSTESNNDGLCPIYSYYLSIWSNQSLLSLPLRDDTRNGRAVVLPFTVAPLVSPPTRLLPSPVPGWPAEDPCRSSARLTSLYSIATDRIEMRNYSSFCQRVLAYVFVVT